VFFLFWYEILKWIRTRAVTQAMLASE